MSKGIRISKEHGVNPMLGQCPLCGGDTGEIFLLGKLKGDTKAPMKGVVPGMSQPCDTCKGYMEQGILFIIVQDNSDPKNPYRTGQIVVVKSEAVERMFSDCEDLLKKRAGFLEEAAARTVGLIK